MRYRHLATPPGLLGFDLLAPARGHDPGWLRLNGSNVPSALTDSLVFPTLAFGAFLWPILLGQFAAKVLGGFVCSLFFRWLDERPNVFACRSG
jgi:uncharacterized PurR-regulated membrane protein YhhQ (DUF165 family)